MLIQHQALAQHIKQGLAACYILPGPEIYFIEEAAKLIKSRFKALNDVDEKIITIQAPSDWDCFKEEVNSYSLFSSHTILDVRYDKKTMDSEGKKVLQHYCTSINSQCLVLIRASNIPVKQLQWLSSSPQTVVVSAYPLPLPALRNWINAQLKEQQFSFNADLIELIVARVQGNMLACAQVIEKICLTHPPKAILHAEEIAEQLSDQSEYQLYELAEACLRANTIKASHLMRKALAVSAEHSLILWIITQEIRTLLQLQHFLANKIPMAQACAKLNIWAAKIPLYQTALNRLPAPFLNQLLSRANEADSLIKSGETMRVCHLLEQIALALCQGKLL